MDATYNLNGALKPTNRRSADLDGIDFYPTPRWATFALTENEQFRGRIWECACGDGAMSDVLLRAGNDVVSTDLYDRGYGEAGCDFLSSTRPAENIITNPPYHSAEGFIARALDLAPAKFAFLLRLSFLEGARRTRTIFHRFPPARVWVFSERITFYPKGAAVAGGGTTAYAWFVWDKSHQSGTELRWFRPGYKARCRDIMPLRLDAMAATRPAVRPKRAKPVPVSVPGW